MYVYTCVPPYPQAHMSPHLPKLLPSLLRELRAQDPVNRQNAAFAAGVLAEGCGAQVCDVRGAEHRCVV